MTHTASKLSVINVGMEQALHIAIAVPWDVGAYPEVCWRRLCQNKALTLAAASLSDRLRGI